MYKRTIYITKKLIGLLHHLPIYASLRVPSRYLGPATVALGLLAVGALVAGRGALERWGIGPRALRGVLVLEVLLVAGVAVDVTLTNQTVLQQGLDPVLPSRPASADFFQNGAASYSRYATFPVSGFGTRACYVPIEWKTASGITDGRGPQVRLEPSDIGSVTQSSWSPNELVFEARLTAPGLLVVNQNYETGWRLVDGDDVGTAEGAFTVGAFVVAQDRFWDIRARPSELPAKGAIGLLAVKLPAGNHHLVLRHRPPGLRLGIVLSLVGVGLSIAVLRRGARDPAASREARPKLIS